MNMHTIGTLYMIGGGIIFSLLVVFADAVINEWELKRAIKTFFGVIFFLICLVVMFWLFINGMSLLVAPQ